MIEVGGKSGTRSSNSDENNNDNDNNNTNDDDDDDNDDDGNEKKQLGGTIHEEPQESIPQQQPEQQQKQQVVRSVSDLKTNRNFNTGMTSSNGHTAGSPAGGGDGPDGPVTAVSSAATATPNSTGSMTGETKSCKAHNNIFEPARTVFYGRYIFIMFLAALAAVLGYLAYYLMSDAEDQITSERFESVTERALSTAQLVIEEKKKATDSLALMMGTANPDAESWPNVYMEGYEQIATSLRVITDGSLSFCPIVVPGGEEQRSFEEFAYDLFYNKSGYPNTTGVSAFGRGVFSYGQGENGDQMWPDNRFHIQSGWTYHNSSRNILVPFIQSDFGPHDTLMLNVHFEHNRAAAIDNSIRCAEERALKAKDENMECGSITDLMWSETAADVDPGPAGLMIVPIYPRNDNRSLTGFILGKQIWSDLLKHGFENDVNGLDVVLRTDKQAHTYRIQGGEAIYLSPGDAHDPNAQYSIVGTCINQRYFSNSTVKYYMDIYSTDEFTQSYSTTNPVVACVGTVLIIIFTSAMFFLFDYFVRKEFHDKKKLLDAKRQFVRFVSHEVRTPLNTVCMGLTLLRQELASALSCKGRNDHLDAQIAGHVGKKHQESPSTVNEADVMEWINLCSQIFENATEAVTVLSDLLNYDKIQMGTLTLELSLLSPWAVMRKTVSEFTLSAFEKGVTMMLDFSPLQNVDDKGRDVEYSDVSAIPVDFAFCKVVADNVRLSQVLRNLISNGLKFSNKQGEFYFGLGNVSTRIIFNPTGKC
jgi:hypothetical protein